MKIFILMSCNYFFAFAHIRFDQGPVSSPVWVENFHCMYHAIDRRYYCDWNGLGITNCSHSKDLALSCQAGTSVVVMRCDVCG